MVRDREVNDHMHPQVVKRWVLRIKKPRPTQGVVSRKIKIPNNSTRRQEMKLYGVDWEDDDDDWESDEPI